ADRDRAWANPPLRERGRGGSRPCARSAPRSVSRREGSRDRKRRRADRRRNAAALLRASPHRKRAAGAAGAHSRRRRCHGCGFRRLAVRLSVGRDRRRRHRRARSGSRVRSSGCRLAHRSPGRRGLARTGDRPRAARTGRAILPPVRPAGGRAVVTAPRDLIVEPAGPDAAAATTGASVLAGGIWKTASTLVPQLYVLAQSIAAARFLGPRGMGLQSFIAFAEIAIVTAASSGFSIALMRYIG